MNNKIIGNACEQYVLEILQNNRWWVHLFAYNANGQPCDIIALKNNIFLLLDVKHCDSDRFSFDNIQQNQLNCFKMASMCGNNESHMGFVIVRNEQTYWLSYKAVKSYIALQQKSCDIKRLTTFGEMMELWK